MLSHKALAARLRLLRKEGVTELSEGDFRVVLGPRPGDERVTQTPPASTSTQVVVRDESSPADLVLNPPAIDYSSEN